MNSIFMNISYCQRIIAGDTLKESEAEYGEELKPTEEGGYDCSYVYTERGIGI